jgi:putative methionine-R-sulfoxide reductase with GAF domain
MLPHSLNRNKLPRILLKGFIGLFMLIEVAFHSNFFCVSLSTVSLSSKKLVSFFVVDGNEIECLVSRDSIGWRIPLGVGIVGICALEGKQINVVDTSRDPRFDPKMDVTTQYETQTILCQPIFDQNGDVIAVIEALNKQPGPSAFTPIDETLMDSVAAVAGIVMEKTQQFQRQSFEKMRNHGFVCHLFLDFYHFFFLSSVVGSRQSRFDRKRH